MGPRVRASRTVSVRDSAGCWPALKGEHGFTLVELLLAMALSAVGIAATIGVFGASSRTTVRAQQGEVGAHQAQAELDRLSKLPYGQLAMTSLPTPSTDPQSPAYGVSGSQFNVRPGLTEALVTQAGEGETAQVDPGPELFAVGQEGATITGSIYRFVTWRDEQCPATICDGTENTKRVTVAVTVDPSPGSTQRGPLWFSTVITDPRAAPADYTGTVGGAGGGGSNTSAQLFYLYDTPCSKTSRQTPSASHNTRSTAQTSPSASGYSTCQNPDATKNPDLMGAAPPNGTNPPVYEYSADLGGDYPGGLAMMRKGSTCRSSYSAADAANTAVPNKWAVHAWATNPFAGAAFHLSGRVTVSMYTATLSGIAGRGLLCATLIERTESGGIASDTPIGSTTYDIASWPTSTRRLSFTFNVSSELDIEVGHRLVLALHLRGESANDIALLYDHPSYQSLLEVETSTPL
jgi:prepilin-type N-terminal cleavage/methylation domain-containing protein